MNRRPEKRIQAILRNPKSVTFEDLRKVAEGLGFLVAGTKEGMKVIRPGDAGFIYFCPKPHPARHVKMCYVLDAIRTFQLQRLISAGPAKAKEENHEAREEED